MSLYDQIIFVHVLLFVFWLGGDLGVYVLGQQFRNRSWSLEQRLALLQVLVMVDMGPRTTWALMVPVSVTMLATGGWLAVPLWLLGLSWLIGGFWLYLVWTAFFHDQTPKAAKLRKIETILKWVLAVGYLAAGGFWLVEASLPSWLAWKALLFGVIFVSAIMIDVKFKPLGPALGTLIDQGSSDDTELPVLKIMNDTRRWVVSLYWLLAIIAWLGITKPGF